MSVARRQLNRTRLTSRKHYTLVDLCNVVAKENTFFPFHFLRISLLDRGQIQLPRDLKQCPFEYKFMDFASVWSKRTLLLFVILFLPTNIAQFLLFSFKFTNLALDEKMLWGCYATRQITCTPEMNVKIELETLYTSLCSVMNFNHDFYEFNTLVGQSSQLCNQ